MSEGLDTVVVLSSSDEYTEGNTEYFPPKKRFKLPEPDASLLETELMGPVARRQGLSKVIKNLEGEMEVLDFKIDRLLQRRKEIEKLREEKLVELSELFDTDQNTCTEDVDFNRREGFPWSETVNQLSKELWNIDTLRYNQLPIINATLSQRDVFVVMPTGGGKSLCYQLPALIDSSGSNDNPLPKLTVVITPLVSLIKDQLHDLATLGISATGIYSSVTKEHRNAITQCLRTPCGGSLKEWQILGLTSSPRLLYVTPEQVVQSKRFMANLEVAYQNKRLARIVIDECHCCSQLGHDFRPDYKKLGMLKIVFQNIPIMALTATCSPSVMDSVMEILHLKPSKRYKGTLVFKSSLSRPNLTYSIVPKPGLAEDTMFAMIDWIQTHHQGETGIIYCLSKKDTETVASAIYRLSDQQISTHSYHADMDDDSKHRVHILWRQKKLQVVVATIAFGLGINHPDVRFVIHHSISKSLDGYYQESGRAGRDGNASQCVVFFRGADIFRVTGMVVADPGGLNQAYAMLCYALCKTRCRRDLILEYFNLGNISLPLIDCYVPDSTTCQNCDVCIKLKNQNHQAFSNSLVDCTDAAITILNLVYNLNPSPDLNPSDTRVTCNQIITLLKSIKDTSLPSSLLDLKRAGEISLPLPKSFTKEVCEVIILRLLVAGYVKEDFHFTAYSSISYLVITPSGRRVLTNPSDFSVKLYLDPPQPSQKNQKTPSKNHLPTDYVSSD